ncbi:glycosyltransferase family 2 protein [Sphingomonas sp. CGMCC 1.13654]|uniref:Glycosyltransferase family 2 protein n=1 Tax=Sphingomonas chungangi TaxID=2683589 RepID=A0A838L9K1_9SPHN|nr:glycosyltransferase family 2 protein [Sphingomonas chungangi]MBA2935951.1 glycosyltransferase family 2 protein [Sphingomonas chungangi]
MIYTILVNWNGWRDTIECLESLDAARQDGLTVVICDNASADDSLVRLRGWAERRFVGAPPRDISAELTRARGGTLWEAPAAGEGRGVFRVVLVDVGANLGFAGGNNVGIAYALEDDACRYIFILNNDTEIDPGALIALERKMDAAPDVAVCGATLVYHDDRGTVQGIGGTYDKVKARADHLWRGRPLADLPDETTAEAAIGYVIGAAIFVRPSLFRRLGGLSETYFLYYEELDLSQRLLPGERLGWARDAVIAHKVGGSIGTGGASARASDLSIYYDHRSKARFYWRYWRPYMPFMLLRLGHSTLAYLRRGDVRAVKAMWIAMGDVVLHDASFRRTFPRRAARG